MDPVLSIRPYSIYSNRGFSIESIGYPLRSTSRHSPASHPLLPQAICDGTTILFADDTTIYVIGNDKSICSSLHLADEWLQTNHLCLNINKTKAMLIRSSRKKNVPSLSVHLHGSLIEQVSVFKFLGVYLNNTLTWSNHIKQVSVKVSRNIVQLRRLSWFLPQSALLLFRGCHRQPLYCFHFDFRYVTLIRYIYIYIYNMCSYA